MANGTILLRLLALTILIFLAVFVFQQLRKTSPSDDRNISHLARASTQKESSCHDRCREYEDASMRYDPVGGSTVNCWPSVGGIIMAAGVSPVELVVLDLNRFFATPRSANATEEDEFCKKLRMVDGKWWESYNEYIEAAFYGRRRLWPDETDVLFIGWPKDGGVWLLRREENQIFSAVRISNALTMEERCEAVKLSGGTFFEKPEDSEFL